MPKVNVDCLHHPLKLRKGQKQLCDDICRYIKKGYTQKAAFLRAGVTESEYRTWKKYYQEEIDGGYTNTPLIHFYSVISQAWADAEADLSVRAKDLAMEGDSKLLTYLLDKEFGWKKKDEVSIKAEDNKIEINIVGMDNPYTEKED